jgi:hypothetical protein
MASFAASDSVAAIADFFEAAIHQIIYIRGIYPEGWIPSAYVLITLHY